MQVQRTTMPYSYLYGGNCFGLQCISLSPFIRGSICLTLIKCNKSQFISFGNLLYSLESNTYSDSCNTIIVYSSQELILNRNFTTLFVTFSTFDLYLTNKMQQFYICKWFEFNSVRRKFSASTWTYVLFSFTLLWIRFNWITHRFMWFKF